MDPTAPHEPGDAPSRLKLDRRHVIVVVGLLIGAVIMLLTAAVNATTGAEVPVLSTLATAPVPDDQKPIAERTPPPPTPGTCLSWRRSDAADAEAIDCTSPHLFEQAGAVQLADIPADSSMPDNQTFRKLVNDRCTPLVNNYLGGKYDPNGAFRAGALKPSQKSWSNGDRSLRCGLQRFSRSGALYPIVGTVSGQDQSDIQQPGTCLGIDGPYVGDPVDCSVQHAIESVGWIDLSQKFDKYPSESDQDKYLQPQCSKLASSYAGGDNVIGDKKLSVLWDNLAQESWNAGSRKVACNLAAQLPDKSGFAPIIGSVKGPVQVGNQPASPARPTASPGAPAQPSPGRDPSNNTGSGDVPNPGNPESPQLPTSGIPDAPKLDQLGKDLLNEKPGQPQPGDNAPKPGDLLKPSS
ncbi:septum formation family protein [Pseudonocardia spinosispora]|uniref:septum formation family protein n=1 Tax=Pseudonocardia spinosispora TaxID=103441 RepID=UPI000406876C|nr:septum formation family protein [Pseudonocardia spinosispora]